MKKDTALDLVGYAGVGILIVLIAAGVILFRYVLPSVLVIWSLNTIFPTLAIPFNSYTVLAAIILVLNLKRANPEKGAES